jgi:hypothetical protein
LLQGVDFIGLPLYGTSFKLALLMLQSDASNKPRG